MKRITRIMALLVLVITLVGCTAGETTSFKLESDGMTSVFTYTHKGDKVIKQTTENEMEYSALGVTTKEEASAIFDAYAKVYDGIEGIEHSIDYQDDKVVEKLSVDFENVDFEVVKELPGVNINGDSASNISLKQIEETLLATGYEKIELQ